MNGVALLVALSTWGVDFAVQQSEDGKQEYVIQIEPEFLRSLAEGQEIHSDVPQDVGVVERVLIRVGTTTPRHSPTYVNEYRNLLLEGTRLAARGGRAAADPTVSILWPAKHKPELNYHVRYGWQPDTSGVLSYIVQLDPTLLATLAIGDEIRAGIDPAAGRVGRFVIQSGTRELPHIPLAPAATASLADADAGRGLYQPAPTALGRNTGQPGYGNSQPGFAAAPSTVAPLASTPDYSPATIPPSQQPQFPSRGSSRYGGVSGQTSDNRAPAATQLEAPGYSRSAAMFESNRFSQPAASVEPPAAYGPAAGYVTHGNEQPQAPLRGSFQSPVGYAAQQVVEDRQASLPRNTATANTSASVPQVNSTSASKTGVEPPAEEKPWMPLMFTAFALFMSIGGNLYLGWTAAEFYSRYRLATERLRSAGRS
jgi:hypothetical protein